MSRFRLTITPPDGDPVRKDRTLMQEVSAYAAMVILMGADSAVKVESPVDYMAARDFAQKLSKAPSRYEMKHQPTGITFMIERTD